MTARLNAWLAAAWHGVVLRLRGGEWVEPSNAITRAAYGPRPSHSFVPLAEEAHAFTYGTAEPGGAHDFLPEQDTQTAAEDRPASRPGRAA